MRVLFVREYFYPDDTGPTFLSDLLRRVRDSHPDVEIDVLAGCHCYARDDILPPSTDWDGIRIERVRAPKTRRSRGIVRLLAGLWLTLILRLRLSARHRRYDVIFLGSDPPTLPIAVLPLARRWRTPVAYYIGDLFPDMAIVAGMLARDSFATRLARRLQRSWLRRADHVIVVGRCMREVLARSYGVPGEKVSVVPNFADPLAIQPGPRETRFRRDNGVEGFVVLYSGNMGAHHRLEDLLEAAAILRAEQPDVTFAMVGGGAKREALGEMVAARELTNVRLLPAVPRAELSDLLASADVCFVTLEPGMEGLAVPSKVYNIMAAGRPIIAAMEPVAEVARMLEEVGCGLRVEHRAPRQIADAILALRQDPARAEEMGARARKALEEHYTAAQVAEQLHDTLRAVAQAGSAATSGGPTV